ncbi:uncharacterized protein [Parasteatoda tepidariorum]|uniref:uncharacterized protein n=1 Tax=Parasteatoda tepidariorum TaxID=114398 RepID=UPI0039BD00B6
MINIIIGPELISPSLYRMWKIFNSHKDQVVKTHFFFFFEKCKTYLSQNSDDKSAICFTCGDKVMIGNTQKSSCFMSISLEAQIKRLINSGLINIPYVKKFNNVSMRNPLSDVNGGKMYQDFKNKTDSLFLTYNFSIDGLAIFNSAKGSLRPILVIINEIPSTIRFKNVLLAGLWFGKKVPKMDLYIKTFVEESIKLAEHGISLGHNNMHACCADSVARSCIQNATQFNGYFGCTWCKHPGFNINNVIKYTYKDHLLCETRKDQETIKLMYEVMHKEKSIQEIKGPSILLPIPFFSVVNGFVPDYMHGIFLGVTKHLVTALFDTRNKSEFHLDSPVVSRIINDRLGKFIFPHNVGRVPRSLNERALFKASEWKNFLLYVCFPCVKDFLKKHYLDHISLLVGAIEILTRKSITID